MTAALEDMRSIVSAQKQSEIDAREASRVQADRQRDADYEAAVEKLRRFIPESVLNGRWTVGRTKLRMNSHREAELALTSTFLPDHIEPLMLLGDWYHTDGGRGPEVFQLQRHNWSSNVVIRRGMSADEIMGMLAPLVIDYVEGIEQQRAIRQQHERNEALSRARQDRIDGKLDEMQSLYQRAVTMDLDRIEAAWGWPTTRAIVAYHVEWTVGVDSNGDLQTAHGWTLVPDLDGIDGFYEMLGRDTLVRKRIQSPTIVTTEHVWSSLDDVPRELRETVHRTRVLRVYEWQGDRMQWVGERRLSDKRQVPGACLRSALGYAVVEIPADTLPYSQNAGGPLVAVVMTADGFEPCDADEIEELPY